MHKKMIILNIYYSFKYVLSRVEKNEISLHDGYRHLNALISLFEDFSKESILKVSALKIPIFSHFFSEKLELTSLEKKILYHLFSLIKEVMSSGYFQKDHTVKLIDILTNTMEIFSMIRYDELILERYYKENVIPCFKMYLEDVNKLLFSPFCEIKIKNI